MKAKINQIKKLDRIFLITKVFLALTPFICYIYLTLRANLISLTLKEILTSDPSIAIVFLIAMINPYIAYILDLVQKKLKDGNYQYACSNLLLLMLSQALLMNVLYFMLLLFILIKVVKIYDIDIFKTIKQLTFKNSLYFNGGSLIVIAFSMICLFATIRLI